MKSLNWIVRAGFWVISLTLFLSLNFDLYISRDKRIAWLQSQLRNEPRTRIIVPLFDSNNPPPWSDFQLAIDTVSAEYKDEIGLTIITTTPLPLKVDKIHSLPEIRRRAEAEYPCVGDMFIMFVSNGKGPVEVKRTYEEVEEGVKVSISNEITDGIFLETVSTIAIYDCSHLIAKHSNDGKSYATMTLKHEIGHSIGIAHNPSQRSFMFYLCNQTLNQWTEPDLQAVWNRRMFP